MTRRVSQPETSMEAYNALQPKAVREMYMRIVGALKHLGTGTYEEIATHLTLTDTNQVSRRLPEMVKMEMIVNTKVKRLTRRKRHAFVYQLTGAQPLTDKQEHAYKKGETTAADHAVNILNSTNKLPSKLNYIPQELPLP